MMKIVAIKGGNGLGDKSKSSMEVSLTQNKETDENILHVNWSSLEGINGTASHTPVQNGINVSFTSSRGNSGENTVQVSVITQKGRNVTVLTAEPINSLQPQPPPPAIEISSATSSPRSSNSSKNAVQNIVGPLTRKELQPDNSGASSSFSGSSRSSSSIEVETTKEEIHNPPIKNVKEWLGHYKEDFERKLATLEGSSSASLNQFKMLKTIGEGSFGRVVLVRHKKTKEYHAMKVFQKRNVVKKEQIGYTINERKLLSAINFPFITKLNYSFKDNSNLYLVLEYVSGGDLYSHLRNASRFSEHQARFYAAQIVLTLEYLHGLGIVYRDLKPENILIDPKGYIKLADFGLAKRVKGIERTMSCCGTPDYIAPEVVSLEGHGKAVDWWALGILIFEMVAGHPPFKGKNLVVGKEYQRVEIGRVLFPEHFSLHLRDLLRKLLVTDVTRRFGNLRRGAGDVKEQEWFVSLSTPIDWEALFQKKVLAPYVPKFKRRSDTRYFPEFEETHISNSERVQFAKEFEEF